jgi:hypothetical protein
VPAILGETGAGVLIQEEHVSVLHLELLGRLKLHQQDVTLLVQQLEPVLLQLQTVLFHLEPVTLIQQEWTCVQLVLPRLNCWIHWCCRCLAPREGLLEA